MDPVARALEALAAPVEYPLAASDAVQDAWIELMELEAKTAGILSATQAGQRPRRVDIEELRLEARDLDANPWADRRDRILYALDVLDARPDHRRGLAPD